jgi:hypothetical protein
VKKFLVVPVLILISLLLTAESKAQNSGNWTERQLMEPSDLAKAIMADLDLPVVISVGPGAIIPSSVHVGMVNTMEGLDKLKTQLKSVNKNKKVVLYCGCCPFEHCPNIRPAIEAVKEMKFTNFYLLNLPHNIKTDWIDKGYPVSKL